MYRRGIFYDSRRENGIFSGSKKENIPIKCADKGKKLESDFLKIKFFIAVMIFIIFLSMDYTGYEFYGIGSEKIIKEVTSDIDFSKFTSFAL